MSESTAGLRGEVNPEGAVTSYRFSYISDAAYRANLAAGNDGFLGAQKVPAGADGSLPSGGAFVTVSQQLFSLAPDTAYRFRVQASNSFSGGSPTLGPALKFTAEPTGSVTFMLDGRGWELVSPLDKGGGEVQGPGQAFGCGTIQAAAAGGALTYSSLSSFGASVPGAPPASQYLATRGSEGWGTANVSAPTVAGAYGPEPDGVPYRLFSADLSRAAMDEGSRYSLRDGAGGQLALSPEDPDLRLVGADPGLAHLVLAGSGGLYRWSGGALTAVGVLPSETDPAPGAALAAPLGAVSPGATRVYFTHGGDLYLREGTVTKAVDDDAGGGGIFEAASADGAVAFFTAGGHLYRYEAAADASADLTPAGGVTGVLGASATGDRAYFQDGTGLKSWRAGSGLVTVAAGAEAAEASNFPPATGTARLSADGSRLAFVSRQPLTGYDNRGSVDPAAPAGVIGVRQSEVFLYDASAAGGAGELICASCNPTGERPLGPSTIPGARPNGTGPHPYKPRALSADGRRLFFDSDDDLALRDRDRFPPVPDPDVYEWEAQGSGSCGRHGGCVALVSSGRGLAGASFLDASASGDDAFFLTSESLLSADTGFADVYDARVGGGFPEPFRPIECVGDACQFLPSEPENPNPGTMVPVSGNPPQRYVEEGGEPAKKKCRRGFVKRKGKCVRKKAAKRRAKKGKGKQGKGAKSKPRAAAGGRR